MHIISQHDLILKGYAIGASLINTPRKRLTSTCLLYVAPVKFFADGNVELQPYNLMHLKLGPSLVSPDVLKDQLYKHGSRYGRHGCSFQFALLIYNSKLVEMETTYPTLFIEGINLMQFDFTQIYEMGDKTVQFRGFQERDPFISQLMIGAYEGRLSVE